MSEYRARLFGPSIVVRREGWSGGLVVRRRDRSFGCKGSVSSAYLVIPMSTGNPADTPPPEDYINAVVSDPDRLQLVVAGPGTGKTALFKRVLTERAGDNLVITFINNLVKDLEKALEGLAAVNTFHGYAKSLLHHLNVGGLTPQFDYYPGAAEILSEETGWLLKESVTHDQVARALHELDDTSGVLTAYIRAADYYNVVDHDDAVYRVVTYFDDHPNEIPVKHQVVVDELQDFNRLEMTLITQLSLTSRVLAAGDDDQALYGFKHATPQYIRDLCSTGDYTLYELPYCFRCTAVIVQAVADIIEKAGTKGSLTGRLEKQFLSHEAKASDSAECPKILAVRCTVDMANAPYPGRYILKQIQAISQAEIDHSTADSYPTAMVIGPKHFTSRVEDVLRPHFPNNIQARGDEPPSNELLDGYTRLSKNDHSRWGWRLVTSADSPQNLDVLGVTAIENDVDLDNLLPGDYKDRHLPHILTVRALLKGQTVTVDDIDALTAMLGITEQEIRIRLGLAPTPLLPAADPSLPTIVITTFMGAKGLSAAYVFVVGMIDRHFPRDPAAITDMEICELIVALTRTRKQCHLITSGRYAGKEVSQSTFFSWIKPAQLKWKKVGQKDLAEARA